MLECVATRYDRYSGFVAGTKKSHDSMIDILNFESNELQNLQLAFFRVHVWFLGLSIRAKL